MIKGIYTSATAMRQGVLRQEMTAANLANAGTSGFKRDQLFVEEMASAESADTNPMQLRPRQWTDFSSGALDPTGNTLDFALQDRGFFVVSDGTNEQYTRNGHFERSADGLLVDTLGRAVQGEGGDITLPSGLVTVSSGGEISVNGAIIDRLRVVNFEDPQSLRRAEGSAFVPGPDTPPAVPVDAPTVRQGFLETSNVDTVREMVDMIAISRAYEINARVITAQDNTLRQTVNEVGRV
ncbi:flagellar basal-body rod protein FlgF [bacterium]|nr:flagellar basal-body rod protein FlgF [bacterium]MBU1983835.1 flagellar basal-body rod protein FlgF [bacterium]